jgi:hypothetical protein
VTFALILTAWPAASSTPKQTAAANKNAAADTTDMTLRGSEEGTIFESLRIEGEDRARIRFERPALNLSLDAGTAPGLDWESIRAVVDRKELDFVSPYLTSLQGLRPVYHSRPWLDEFARDGVARFRPNLEGVDRWRMLVADSKGDTVTSFTGKGKPPKEIVWDGRSSDGRPMPPGLTYSYVLEAYDRAGNRRRFVGDGFELPPYRLEDDRTHVMLFSGCEITGRESYRYDKAEPPSKLLLEVASLLNQESAVDNPLEIEVTARTFDVAKRLAKEMLGTLEPLLLGDPARVQTQTRVEKDAPEAGTVAIKVTR